MDNRETHIFFSAPYGDKCIGCPLLAEASLVAADKIVINCYAKTLPDNKATMKFTAVFNSDNDSRLGSTQTIDGNCQAK